MLRAIAGLALPNRLAVAACVSLAGSTLATAQVVLVAHDSFDYSSGTLTGRNGGSGWTSAWSHAYTFGGPFNVDSSGLNYTGLSTSGGRMAWAFGGNGISENNRTLSLVNSGVAYIQFLGQFGSNSGGGTPNLRLYAGGTQTGAIGGNGGTYNQFVSILDASLSPASNGSSSSSALLSSLNLVVVRIDYTAQSTSLYINPNLSTFNYLNPGTPAATYTGLAPAFDQVALYSRDPASFDELSIMTVAVPEPTWTGCAAAAAAGVFVLLRRRHTR